MTDPSPFVASVNIGTIQAVEHNGRQVTTAIYKTPTTEPQVVAGVHIGEDLQADTVSHGGTHKAIYAYASEDNQWWASELDLAVEPGFFGENLTTTGLDLTSACVGDRWRIGSCVLEVSEPRLPCFKLGIRAAVPRTQQRFSRAERPGTYLRIVEEGELVVGDSITVEPTNSKTVSVGEIFRCYYGDHSQAAAFVDIEALSDAWRDWARSVSGAST